MPPLPRALFTGLFDDAAVFPPGSSPLDAAVAAHRRLRRGPDADLIGPLLLPAAALPTAADLAGLADLTADPPAEPEPPSTRLPADAPPQVPAPVVPPPDRAPASDAGPPQDGPPQDEPPPAHRSVPQDRNPLGITLIARPGSDPHELALAAALAHDDPRVELRGVELGWQDDWRELRLDVPLIVLEIPRGTEQALALTDIATAVAESDTRARRHLAKFRTGRTETWPWPAERELAHTIQAAIAMDVPLKLTGGLHHAVRCSRDDGEHHGVLNVLATVAAARAGRPVDALAALLAHREPAPLVQALAGLSPTQVTKLRGGFPAYGCCTVTDPIGELTALGVLEGARS